MVGPTNVDSKTLGTEIKARGWKANRIGDQSWRLRMPAAGRWFSLCVGVDGEFVTFAIVPFVKSPADLTRCDELYTKLLQLNEELLLAKLSIDDDLDVVLSVEHPISEMDSSQVTDALDVLVHYANEHYEKLQAFSIEDDEEPDDDASSSASTSE